MTIIELNLGLMMNCNRFCSGSWGYGNVQKYALIMEGYDNLSDIGYPGVGCQNNQYREYDER